MTQVVNSQMFLVIVFIFVNRYMLDRKSAVHVSARVQDLFFIMAVSNSCMDPLVYGSYIIDPRTLKRTIRKIFCIHVSPSEIPGMSILVLSKSVKTSIIA